MFQFFSKNISTTKLLVLLLAAASTHSYAISVTADQVIVFEDTPAILDVLENDVPQAGSSLITATLSILDAPGSGYAAIENGKIVYQANQNFNGNDTLTYQISDSSGNTGNGTVQVTVNAVDDPVILTESLPVFITQQNVEASYILAANDADGENPRPLIFQAIDGFSTSSVSGYELTFTNNSVGRHRGNVLFLDGSLGIGRNYPFYVDSHGAVADRIAIQTVPAYAASGQPVRLSYQYPQSELYGSTSVTTQQLQITLKGDFSITSIAGGCLPVLPDHIWQQSGQVTIRCTPAETLGSDPVTITITPASTGPIESSLVIPNVSGEALSSNNQNQKIIHVIAAAAQTASQQITRTAASSIASADADGDGDLDILVAPEGFGQATWYINNGQGILTQGEPLAGYQKTQKIVVGDLNNDDIAEILLVADDGAVQQYQRQNNRYILQSSIAEWGVGVAISNTIRNAQLADLNNDNYPELVTAAGFFARGVIFENQNGVLQAASSTITSQLDSYSVALADFNNDNQIDAVFPRRFDTPEVLFNNGNSNALTSLAAEPLTLNASGIDQFAIAANLNGDIYSDLIITSATTDPIHGLDSDSADIHQSGRINLFTNVGANPWLAATPSLMIETQPITGIEIADFDTDTDSDIIISTTEDMAFVFTNNSGSLAFSDFAFLLPEKSKFTVADINADGYPDIIAASTEADGLSSFINPQGTPLPLNPDENTQVDAHTSSGGGNMMLLFIFIFGVFVWFKIYQQRSQKD
ncbi:FG-GAP-like repeat-containing protein [Pelagibaculum spongiae]|uniref:Cadherin-like domain-containing protein n=1 Tax=Pelagibaculum spongiae TaxID=2080658 RepID=A0A2V1GVW8_9GAMM|nr:FG-GAP-like repeat-containing protein [Pelagibaculum spongiae]PVZ70468.1 hypothetical protein DC094_07750 [Pelagibaculum spongiae]